MKDTKDKQPVIVLRDLHKSYGAQKVLDGISLTVASGETVAVLGRSGSGKSVLLKLVVGLQKPDSGSIQVQGKEITALSLEELNGIRTQVGYLFQEAALYDSLSIEENVMFPLKRHNKTSRQQQVDRARDLLSAVGMEDARAKMPAEISGGMKKRVGLARALALEPSIVLFDEPTAGLDPITAREIEELILKLQKEHRMASVVVTHDLRGAKSISNRLALIHDGGIAVEGTFNDLKKSTDEFVVQFLREAT